LVSERETIPPSGSRSTRPFKRLAVSNGYRPRGAQFIKKSFDVQFIHLLGELLVGLDHLGGPYQRYHHQRRFFFIRQVHCEPSLTSKCLPRRYINSVLPNYPTTFREPSIAIGSRRLFTQPGPAAAVN